MPAARPSSADARVSASKWLSGEPRRRFTSATWPWSWANQMVRKSRASASSSWGGETSSTW